MNFGVSCLCLTYGRPSLLEEAIESFHRQTWNGPKELIVVNDHPDQKLFYSHPEVVIVNLDKRINTLGEKRNYSVSLAKYDNLLIWDDDDIFLPWRIEETMKTLPSAQFFKCPRAWVMNDGIIEKDPGYNLFHSGTAYTKWLFDKVGGYKAINGGEDGDIEYRFQHVTKNVGEFWKHTWLEEDRIYYIYRWSHGAYHATGCHDLQNIKPIVNEQNVLLKPHWNVDYTNISSLKVKSKKVNFICFSKNRPLQLDGYIRSFLLNVHNKDKTVLKVLYDCDPNFSLAYKKIIESYPFIEFKKQNVFHDDLVSLFDASEYTAFGCDDVVFTSKVDIDLIIDKMKENFAFSLRLGKNIKKSMFVSGYSQPVFTESDGLLTWDLHTSHSYYDFGYSWELNGTVYPTDIAYSVCLECKSNSPNLLENSGGDKWSKRTRKSLISCFKQSKMHVVTVNVVQKDFTNPIIGSEVSPSFLLDAWNAGLRLDVSRYQGLNRDCIHIQDLYLTNKLE